MKKLKFSQLFYGYYVVGACFITLFMTWGMVVNSFAIFFKPIEMGMEWSRAVVSMAAFTRSLGTALSAPIAGRLIDRVGAKPVMLAGTLIMGLGLLGASQVTQPWQYYAIFALIGVGLMCATVIPCSLIISNWFVSRRGTAMALAFVGTSVGGAFWSPAANWIILNCGWRAAFAFNGLTLIVLVVPIILFIVHTRPSEIGLEPYRNAVDKSDTSMENWGVGIREAFTVKAFWQIAFLMFIIGLVTNAVHTHAVRYLIDVGHSDTRAAYAWSLVMTIMIFGKLSFGPIADRWGAPYASAFEFVMYTGSIVALLFAGPYGIAVAFACLYGFACGGPLTLNPLLTVNNLGIKNYGAIYGILTITASFGAAVGPVGAGAFFDRFDTYVPVFIAFAILTALGIACSAMIKQSSHIANAR
jgi:MFS family permease